MSQRRGTVFFLLPIFVLLGVLIPILLLSYDDKTTHPALTEEMVELFNKAYPHRALTPEEKELVVQGSIDEDTWPRWINHFYDPILNQGWTGEHFGRISSTTAQLLSRIMLSDVAPLTSKRWAESSEIQMQYRDFGGDRSWQRGLYALAVQQDRKESLRILGHILHLLEDATVPDHTRNDTHAHPLYSLTGDIGSPYELYASHFFRSNILVTAESLWKMGERPVHVSSLGWCFDSLAYYSATHFFSKDTIGNTHHALPAVVAMDTEFAYGRDERGVFFPLARVEVIKSGGVFKKIFSLATPQETVILEAYFQRLSKQAIVHGAGVIALFFDEARAIERGERVQPVVASPQSKIVSVLTGVTYLKSLALNFADDIRAFFGRSENEESSPVLTFAPVTTSSSAAVQLMTSSSSRILGVKVVPKMSATYDKPVAFEVASPANDPPPIVIDYPVYLPNAVPVTQFVPSGGGAIPAISEVVNVTVSPLNTSTLIFVVPAVSTTLPSVSSTTVLPATSVGFETSTAPSSSVVTTTLVESLVTSTPSMITTTTVSVVITSTSEVVIVPPVVINEIAWAGTGQTTQFDEWFELRNTTDAPIDITGWQVRVDATLWFVSKSPNKIIPPQGFLLLEKMRDQAVNDMPADIIYSDITFRDTGGVVTLFNSSSTLVDSVSFSQGWPAGNTSSFASMERISASASSSDPANWQSSLGSRVIGRAQNGAYLKASPRQSNFGSLVLDGVEANCDRTLYPVHNPYLLQYYQISQGCSLTIAPGVVIKSYYTDARLDVYGSLKVQGESESQVVFTSGRDTIFRSVGSWSSSTPQAGDWRGIRFYPGSSGELSHVTVRFAGRPFRLANDVFSSFVTQAVRAEGAQLSIHNSTFYDNGLTTIFSSDSSLEVVNTNFIRGDKAVETIGGVLTIDGSVFDSFTHLEGAIRATGVWPKLSRLTFVNSAFSGVHSIGALITSTVSITKDWPMLLTNATILPGGKMSIEPGSHIFMRDSSLLEVKGELDVLGTAVDPVIFAPFGSEKWWNGIHFVGGVGRISGAQITGANYTFPLVPDFGGAIVVSAQSDVSIVNSSIIDNRAPGNTLYSSQSKLVIENTRLGHSSLPGLPTTGLLVNGGEVHLQNVEIANVLYGLRVGTSTTTINGLPENITFSNVTYPFDPVPSVSATSTNS
jgi:hypothetical protein